MGFRPEDYETDDVELWPENEAAIGLFSSLSTQWRVGAGGPTGLDYNVLFYRMDRMRLSDEAHQQLFDDIRVIESEALQILNQKQD
jgi:hypothetical protein